MLEKFENVLMAVLAVLGLGLVCTDVVLRYFFPQHLTDYGMELTIYFTVWAIFIAGAPLVREARHVRADIILHVLPAGAQRVLEILALLIGLAFVVIISWYGWQMVISSYGLGERSESSLKLPLYIYYMSLPVGTTLMIPPYIYRLYLYLFRFDARTMVTTEEHLLRDK